MGSKFDAIVVGAGASGGLAAALLCESGLSVLLLDAGRKYSFWKKPLSKTLSASIGAISDPRLGGVLHPRLINAGTRVLRAAGRLRQPVQTECFAWVQKPDGFVDDRDHPYETPQGKPFTWIRSHGVGGRMVVPGHGRQYYRLSEFDLGPRNDLPSPWPFGIEELAPWYEKVECRLGLFGGREGVPYIPDSAITHPISPNISEQQLFQTFAKLWPKARVMLSRYAPPVDFVGNAGATSRLTLRTSAIAQRVLCGADGRTAGVEWIDPEDGQLQSANAPLVFLCASSLESTRILLNSSNASGALPEQLPALGLHLSDHVMLKAEGLSPPLPITPPADPGRCLYLPRFDLRNGGDAGKRGFGIQLYATANPAGAWTTAVGFGETSQTMQGRLSLSRERKDRWGQPVLSIDTQWGEAERALADSMSEALDELFDGIGAKVLARTNGPANPGTSVHECGGARIGRDSATSVLTPHNECWAMPGLFVTDGASLPSQGTQNPTLTIMALTARACQKAVGG